VNKANLTDDRLLALVFASLSLLLPLSFYLNLGGTFSLALFGGLVSGTLGLGFSYRCRQKDNVSDYAHWTIFLMLASLIGIVLSLSVFFMFLVLFR